MGAGLAGLCAARELARAGAAATVFEASERVGGRVRSDRRGYWADGQMTEWCAELIDTQHQTMHGLVRELGLHTVDLIAAEPAGSSDTLWVSGQRYPPARVKADFEPVRARLRDDLGAAGSVSWREHTGAGLELDAMTVRDWIDSRVPGGAASPLGRFLEVAYVTELAAEATEQSALNLVYALAGQPEGSGFSIFGQSDERFRIEGGNEQLPQAIAAELPEPVRHGWRLEAIAARADGRVKLVFDEGGHAAEVTAGRVILAVPFSVLREVDYARAGFDARKQAAIEELGCGRSAKLALQFDSRYWATEGPWGLGNGTSYTDAGYQSTWEATRGQPGGSAILVNYTGGETAARFTPRDPRSDADGDPAVRGYANRLVETIEPVFPGLAAAWNGRATLSVPALDPLERASYPFYRPGQYHRFAGYERERMGNVLFAGDHCSVEYQGYMEGAASEGRRAAQEILAELRR